MPKIRASSTKCQTLVFAVLLWFTITCNAQYEEDPDLKRFVGLLEVYATTPNEVVFVLDESGSIGGENFPGVIHFTEMTARLLSLSEKDTRADVVTFGTYCRQHINYIEDPFGKNMCTFLGELAEVDYAKGYTYTGDAMVMAREIFTHARKEAFRIIILMTDGDSNGGYDLETITTELKNSGVIIFVVGIASIKRSELEMVASSLDHIYIMKDLKYIFELNKDLRKDTFETNWDYASNPSLCNHYCDGGHDCCDSNADCMCGTRGGKHECVCRAGYQGQGIRNHCSACPEGTYKETSGSFSCAACPGNSTTYETGKTTADDCKCLLGYKGRPQDKKACEVVRCSKLAAPPNGVILPSNCGSIYGSECTFKCNEGYCPYSCNEARSLSTVGVHPWNTIPQERRQCNENGLWTGRDFHCEKVKCPSLNFPKHGQHNCTTSDFSFNTVCSITCKKGFSLTGSTLRKCLISGMWTGKETKCSADFCPPLKTNQKLRVEPPSCGSSKSEYQSVCQYHCTQGFKLEAHGIKDKVVGERQCLLGGKWSNSDERLFCKDDEVPKIKCPPFIETPTNWGKATALVHWDLPVTSDNVAVDDVKIIHPKNVKKPPHVFPIGKFKIVYQVQDTSGLLNNCTFSIHVVDKEPPRITYCPSNIEKLHDKSNGLRVYWQEPEFEDNSGQAYIQKFDKRNGAKFYWGNPVRVTYTISDQSKNTAICSFSVKVKGYSCPYMDPPTNGFLACDTWSDGQFCKVSCKKGFTFMSPPEEVYFCSQKTKNWTKFLEREEPHLPWPDCAKIRKPRGINSTISAKYSVSACSDADIEAVKNDFIKTARGRKFCPPNPNLSCVIKNVNVTCKLPAESLRVKRSILNFDPLFDVINSWKSSKHFKVESSSEAQIQDLGTTRKKRQDNKRPELDISFNIEIYETLEKNDTLEECENCSSTDVDPMFVYGTDLSEVLKSQIDDVVDKGYKEHSPVTKDFVLKAATPICRNGSIVENNTCVDCPVGTYFNTPSRTCIVCPKDHYQDEDGSLTCKKCPTNKLTLHTKAKHIDDCKGPCPLGLYSTSGLEPCIACAKGTYADMEGSKSCNLCPRSLLTSISGAISANECVSACGRGMYSDDGFPPCVSCPKGTYQSKLGSLSCQKCPNGTTTIVENADAITFCQTFHFCEDYKPCMTGSTCIDLTNDYECICSRGFAGRHCDVNLNDCDADSCLNDGVCHDGIDNVTCVCPSGFSGFRCEINNDDCHPDACQNGGTCEDLVDDYVCHCADGYLGSQCEVNIDECASNPCKNNGTCFDSINDFMCCCPEAFTGRTCDVEVDNCDEVVCLNGGTCESTVEGFSCVCIAGFEGMFCETNTDDCEQSTCLNGGTCVDGINNTTCFCPDTFYGHHCEKDLLMEFSLQFPLPLTINYVLLHNKRRLFAITASFFMRTNYVDKDNKGTPISYTFQGPNNEFKDNVLTLMDPNNLILYVHGQLFYTNVVANQDFDWHHYAVTWDNAEGSWAFYIDGSIIISGDNVAKGEYMYPGIFVLGQDQDSLGGSFSIGESFTGEITEFNVWDYSLTSQEINTLGKNCGFLGNVIKWPVVQNHVFGNVVVNEDVDWCKNVGACPFESCYCGMNNGTMMSGHVCKQKVDDCATDPCQNGQKCVSLDSISYCDCSVGFDGRRCEHDIDECTINNGNCEHLCINTLGSYKCLCTDGLQLSADNHTCFETSICTIGKSLYNDGDKWMSNCEECHCKLGAVSCSMKACPNISCELGKKPVLLPGQCCKTCMLEEESSCVIGDDDTLETFDGQIYDFFGYCQYILVDSDRGDFGIQFQTFKESENDNRKCKRSLLLRNLCMQLLITANGSLEVDGEAVGLPYEDDLFFAHSGDSGEVTVRSSLGVTINWSCSGNVSVTVPSSYKKQLAGLCGNFNNKYKDDVAFVEFPPQTLITETIRKWRVYPECFEEQAKNLEVKNIKNLGFTSQHIERIRLNNPWVNLNCVGIKPYARKRLRNICQSIWKKPFNLCHRFVNPHEYFILCLQDVCIFSSRPKAYCNALLAYSIECMKHGVHIDYLTAVRSCRKYCPADMVYKECGPVCPATCSSTGNEGCDSTRCVRGCFCVDDKVLDEEGDCIHVNECHKQ